MAIDKSNTQLTKFKRPASVLESDDSEERFNERLGKIVKRRCGQPPNPKKRGAKTASPDAIEDPAMSQTKEDARSKLERLIRKREFPCTFCF